MAQVVEVVDKHARRLTEVEVEHVQTLGVLAEVRRAPPAGARRASGATRGIFVADVQQHDAVDHFGVGDAAAAPAGRPLR